jgi:hypothetical protein
MEGKKHILVVDVPANATAAEVEQMLNAPYEDGYYVQTIACGVPGAESRAIFRLHKREEWNARKSDGKGGAAIAYIADNMDKTAKALKAGLMALNIVRSAAWIADQKVTLKSTGVKLTG